MEQLEDYRGRDFIVNLVSLFAQADAPFGVLFDIAASCPKSFDSLAKYFPKWKEGLHPDFLFGGRQYVEWATRSRSLHHLRDAEKALFDQFGLEEVISELERVSWPTVGCFLDLLKSRGDDASEDTIDKICAFYRANPISSAVPSDDASSPVYSHQKFAVDVREWLSKAHFAFLSHPDWNLEEIGGYFESMFAFTATFMDEWGPYLDSILSTTSMARSWCAKPSVENLRMLIGFFTAMQGIAFARAAI